MQYNSTIVHDYIVTYNMLGEGCYHSAGNLILEEEKMSPKLALGVYAQRGLWFLVCKFVCLLPSFMTLRAMRQQTNLLILKKAIFVKLPHS